MESCPTTGTVMTPHRLLAASGNSEGGQPPAAPPTAPGSHFLDALPERERRELLDHSQRIEIAAHTLVAAHGTAVDYCYFIEQGLVSCMLQLADGFESASAMIGSEGVINLHGLAAAGAGAPHDSVTLVPTAVRRIPAAFIRSMLESSPELLSRILRFEDALRLQVAQLTVCNLHHNVQQRLARWLLMAYDRGSSRELPVTQESLSAMVGARRASVTLAARALRDSDAIDYQYGHLYLRDRSRLEAMSCECYATVRRHYQRLVGWPAPV